MGHGPTLSSGSTNIELPLPQGLYLWNSLRVPGMSMRLTATELYGFDHMVSGSQWQGLSCMQLDLGGSVNALATAVHFFPTALRSQDIECLAAVQEICRPQWTTIKSLTALGMQPLHRTLDALIGSSLKKNSCKISPRPRQLAPTTGAAWSGETQGCLLLGCICYLPP